MPVQRAADPLFQIEKGLLGDVVLDGEAAAGASRYLQREKGWRVHGVPSDPRVGESTIEPIRNPVTGEEHRARIQLPFGFEYKVAEMGNTVRFKVVAPKLTMDHTDTYAQLNSFDWSNL